MNLSRNTPRTILAAALSLLTLSVVRGYGQTTATTDPVGYASISCLANSDTLVSIPFARPTTFAGATSGTIPSNTITFAGSPGFTASAYKLGAQSDTFYALIGPNILGLATTVGVTNGSATVTGTGLSAIAVNDELLVNGLAYNVASVATDGTSLTLSRAYTGATSTAATAQYDHSPKEGCYYTVTDNDATTLTVDLNGDSLSAVASGTTVSLIPYWSLGTAFPSSAAYDATNNPTGSFVASSGITTLTRGTQVLMPDLVKEGTNLASSATYIFYNSHWRIVNTSGVDTTDSFDSTTLPPTTYFTVRNRSTGTTFTPSGGVYMNRITATLDTPEAKLQTTSGQDNAVAVPRPTAVSLNDLGLISSGAFAISNGVTNLTRGDTLLTYDNTIVGVNKASSASYIFYSGAWRILTANGVDTADDYGSTTIPYGTGFIIRKKSAQGGITAFWQNTRNY